MSEIVELTEPERAGVILMLLGDEEAAAILGRLDPDELQILGRAMIDMSDIGPRRIANAIGGFVHHANVQELSARDRPQRLRDQMARAVGDFKADSVMQQIVPPQQGQTIEIARWLAPQVLVELLTHEQPQAIAVLLMMLDPVQAALVLAALPASAQPRIVERIARCGPVPAQAVAMLNRMLEARISHQYGAKPLQMGGAREAANLINEAAGAVEQTVMPALKERDAALAALIEAEMFRFSMVLALDEKDVGRLLRDIDNETLIDALKGIAEPERNVFYNAMSRRAADGLKEELELRGKVKRSAVEIAQESIIETARKLANDGEIQFGGGSGGDDDYV